MKEFIIKKKLIIVTIALLLALVVCIGMIGYNYGFNQCSQQIITADLTAVYEDGYQNGYDNGYDEGYTEGNNDGLEVGYEKGKDEGYDSGYDEGYAVAESEKQQTYSYTSGNSKDEDEIIVYVSSTGECYHKKDCYHISGHSGVISMSLEEAEDQGYRACKDCGGY